MYIVESLIWTTRTSVSNMRTTLLLLELLGLPEFFLPYLTSGTGSVSADRYTSGSETQTALSRSLDKFKAFFRYSLGASQAFVETYWKKIKRDS